MLEALLTRRLRLEPWGERHDAMLVAWSATPAVTRYVGDGRTWTEARALDVAAGTAEHWRRHGFGWRAAYLRDAKTGPARPVGLIALSFAGEGAGIDPGEYEIGWWLDPGVWGRGLAREGATAVRDDAFTGVGAPSLVARISPANRASLAVAQAIGLEFEAGSRGRGGEPISVLRLTAEAWASRRAAPAPAPRPTTR